MAADFSIGIRKGLEQQTSSLFQSSFEFFDGKMNGRQHDFGIDYTISQIASLCASFLGIFCLCKFGRFDPEQLQVALFKSKLFANQSKSDIPNKLSWGLRVSSLECWRQGIHGLHLHKCRLVSAHKNSHETILILYHTNHLLNQFLEDIFDIGVSTRKCCGSVRSQSWEQKAWDCMSSRETIAVVVRRSLGIY